jgi:hypothetical protein
MKTSTAKLDDTESGDLKSIQDVLYFLEKRSGKSLKQTYDESEKNFRKGTLFIFCGFVFLAVVIFNGIS